MMLDCERDCAARRRVAAPFVSVRLWRVSNARTQPMEATVIL